jgi:hypothetical protein
MAVHGVVMLSIRLGEVEDVISTYVVRGLPLPMLSGTPFTNRYVRYIDCQAQLVQMLGGSRVALLEKTDKVARALVSHRAYLAPMSEMIVRCRTISEESRSYTRRQNGETAQLWGRMVPSPHWMDLSTST